MRECDEAGASVHLPSLRLLRRRRLNTAESCSEAVLPTVRFQVEKFFRVQKRLPSTVQRPARRTITVAKDTRVDVRCAFE